MDSNGHVCQYISETNPPECIVCSKVDPSYTDYNMDNNGHVCQYVLESMPPKCICGRFDPSYAITDGNV